MCVYFLLLYPFLEVALFIQACRLMGWLAIWLTIATSLLGLFLLRVQRRYPNFGRRDFSSRSIENYLFFNLGAFALLLPGFLTDIFGIIILIPLTRRLVLKLLRFLRIDFYRHSLGPFSVFKTYTFGTTHHSSPPKGYEPDIDSSEVVDVESHEISPESKDESQIDLKEDVIEVDFTVHN